MDRDRIFKPADTSIELTYLDGYEVVKRTSPTGEISLTASPSRSSYYTPTWNGYSSSTTLDGSSYMWERPSELIASSSTLTPKEVMEKIFEREGLPKMDMDTERIPNTNSQRYRVVCHDEKDLAPDRILKNISIMKSKLMMECAPVHLKNIECEMTPVVKDNLIKAWRKLNMFGKKMPFVARFDEYGNRLEDEIRIETLEGMKIKIISPDDYCPYYLSFQGVITDLFQKR